MDKMTLWNGVKAVPADAQKKITGGRLKGMTDIKPQWRLQVLTEQFGPCGIGWYYESESWTEAYKEDTVSAHVKIKLYVMVNGEWSKPIEGQGGSMLVAAEKAGPYHSDEAFKMATTDAISVACKQLGIGANVYLGHPFGKETKPQAPQGDATEEWKNTWIARIRDSKYADDGHRASLIKMVEDAARSGNRDKASAAMDEIKKAINGN